MSPLTFALVGLQVLDHLNGLDGPERTEQLPEHVLLRFGGQIINKDAPAGAVNRIRGQHRVAQDVTGQGREPNRGGIETGELETTKDTCMDTSTKQSRARRLEPRYSPEPPRRVVDGPREASVRLRRQVRGQRRKRLVDVAARVVGELDGDGLRGALGRRPVQRLDRALRLAALVEPDEADALRQT